MSTSKDRLLQACKIVEQHSANALRYANDLELLQSCKTAADYEQACKLSYKLGYSDMGEGRSIDEMKEQFKVNEIKFSFPNLLLCMKIDYCIYNINYILNEEMLPELGDLLWEFVGDCPGYIINDIAWMIAFSSCGLEIYNIASATDAKEKNLKNIVLSAVERHLLVESPIIKSIPETYKSDCHFHKVPQKIEDVLGFLNLRKDPGFYDVDGSQLAKKSKYITYCDYFKPRISSLAKITQDSTINKILTA